MLSQPTYPVLIVNRKRSSCTATKQGVPNDAGVSTSGLLVTTTAPGHDTESVVTSVHLAYL